MAPEAVLVHALLTEMLDYDQSTGVFTRRITTSSRAVKGQVAGTVDPLGYTYIQINGRRYLAHRLAWFYVHRSWPNEFIDHINGQRSDNRLINLREATRQQNNWNSRMKSKNRSGVKGVHWSRKDQRWQAQMHIDGRNKFLGNFHTIEEARQAYQNAVDIVAGEYGHR